MYWSASSLLKAGAAGILILSVAACAPQREARPVCDFDEYEDALQNEPTGETLVPVVEGTILPMPLNSVHLLSNGLSKKIMVQATNAGRTDTGQVEVFARFVNCTDETVVVEARTNFLKASQAPAEPATAWSRQVVGGHQIFTYTAKSIAGPDVGTYLIEVREQGV